MTEAMPFLQKAILLSYDPRPFPGDGTFLFGIYIVRCAQTVNEPVRTVFTLSPVPVVTVTL